MVMHIVHITCAMTVQRVHHLHKTRLNYVSRDPRLKRHSSLPPLPVQVASVVCAARNVLHLPVKTFDGCFRSISTTSSDIPHALDI